MLARIRKAEQNDKGFTLIELLVVVIIIGILSAIAIPTFLKQREKGWDKAVKSDLRNNALLMEQYLDDNDAYPTTGAIAGFKLSDTVTSVEVVSAALATGFCLKATSAKLTADDPKFPKVQYFKTADGKPSNTACTTGAA
jgi:type IV pilus assembly protein PilA